MSIDWAIELPLIQASASKHNLDYQWIRTIRAIENGGEGKQFGVLGVGADSYQAQLEVCCTTVAHRLEIYPANPLQRCYSAASVARMRYTRGWISYFASIWAPIGVSNDPTKLNSNWLSNALLTYSNFIQAELNATVS